MIGALLALFVLAMILWSLLKGLGVVKSGPNFGDPKATIALTLAVFNLVVWGMIPWFWSLLTYQWYIPILFNLGLGAFLYLSNADAKKLASLVGGALIVGLLTTAAYKVDEKFNLFGQKKTGLYTEKGIAPTLAGTRIESDAPPQQIADCESGNGSHGSAKQFLPGTTIPVRNPQDGKPGTGAVGYWQINLNDPHVAQIVKDHNWDVENSKADNDAAAKYLWSQPLEQGGGTAPWTASATCWGSKITMPGGVIVSLEAPVDNLSVAFPIPPRDFDYKISGNGKKYLTQLTGYTEENGQKRKFIKTIEVGVGGSKETVAGITETISVRSLEKEAIVITITLTPKKVWM